MLIPTVVGILLAIGAIGNILVIVVSIKSKRAQRKFAHTWLIFNIAIADFTYLIITGLYYVSIQFVHTFSTFVR